MMPYYVEDIIIDDPVRQNYADGITLFLEKEKEKADAKRLEDYPAFAFYGSQDARRDDFRQMLGYPLGSMRQRPTLIEKKFVTTDQNVKIYRMRFSFFNAIPVYGLYFEQNENARDKPFVIGFHGGEGTPELVSSIIMPDSNYTNLVRRITDRGANVFVPQLLLWNQNTFGGSYDRVKINGKLTQLGSSITALELTLASGALNWFIDAGYANPERIGAAGMSYGGMYAFFLAAVDPRIRSCYSSSYISNSFIQSTADWSYFGMAKRFTEREIGGLIAPRRLVIGMGNRDPIFSYRETLSAVERIREIYRLYGSENDLICRIFDGEHEVDSSDEEIILFLQRL